MEETGLKWTVEEGKDGKGRKAFLPRGAEGGFASCGEETEVRELDLTCARRF